MTEERLLVELVNGVKWSYHFASDGSAVVDYPWEGDPYDPTIDKPSGALVVPSRLGGRVVEAIEENAFAECQNITSVFIPEGVKTIGACAFWGCVALESIVLPASIRTIHDLAFWDCKQLTSIILPEGIDSIEHGVFSGCSSLRKLRIPKTVSVIGDLAFDECRQLESVELAPNVVSIGESAFSGCANLMNLHIPDSVVSIGYGAFNGCARLGAGIVVVDDCVLTVNGKCPSTLVLPEGVRLIADGAFAHCADNGSILKKIGLPSSLLSIGSAPFSGCSSLIEINVHQDNDNFMSCDGALYVKTGERLLKCPAGRKGEFVVPEFVREIADFAFGGCKKIASIRFPAGLKTIGDFACADCDDLRMVVMPTGAEFYGNEIFNRWRRLTISVQRRYAQSLIFGLKQGYSFPLGGVDIIACDDGMLSDSTSSMEQIEELAEDGDAAAMCKLAYWHVDNDMYRTVDLIAHSAMRLNPVAMTVIARLMLRMSQPGKNNRGRYWTWGIAIMAHASSENSIAAQDLRTFTDELVDKINRMKFGDNHSKYDAGLQKMSFAIESFMGRMRKCYSVVRSVMNQYSVEHKNVYHTPLAEFD